jgi:hypothetical protein
MHVEKHGVDRKGRARGTESVKRCGDPVQHSLGVHLGPSCLASPVPALAARLGSHLSSRHVAVASAPCSRYWIPLCRRGHPRVLRKSFVSGGEDQKCSHSRGASADLSIFPLRCTQTVRLAPPRVGEPPPRQLEHIQSWRYPPLMDPFLLHQNHLLPLSRTL